MFDFASAIQAVADLGTTITKAIVGDPTVDAQAKATIIKAQVDSVVAQLQAQQAIMLAEAKSADPWTSRARPSFMYVVYVLLLFSIPMGAVYAISPQTAADFTSGMQAWFAAIPKDIIELFKWVMLGYIGGRSAEKVLVKK